MMALTTQGRELPQFVRDMLASAPKVGEGVNSWLFRVARVLHPYRAEPEIVALIGSAIHGEHVRPGEIERAVRNSKAAAWQPGETVPPVSQSKWPAPDAEKIRSIADAGPTAYRLWEQSPVLLDAEDEAATSGRIVAELFTTPETPDPLVCVGKSNTEFATRPLAAWQANGRLATFPLIVPSPMSKRSGTTKEGKESEHCLDNTGPRRFLVVEFDEGTADDHAARLWHLAGSPRWPW